MCGISTFVETTTVSADSAVKVAEDIPLDKVCLLGCGVGTGWGSAVNSAQVQPGHTVIVMGIGGIGINAVQGASHAGAANVIAVDPVAFKREKAQELGATHAVETMEEATELAKRSPTARAPTSDRHRRHHQARARRSGDGLDPQGGHRRGHGARQHRRHHARSRSRWPTSRCSRSASRASLFGESNPNWDILRQVELYRSGVLKLDELITKTYTLDEIQQGYQDMHDGKNQKGVVVFD